MKMRIAIATAVLVGAVGAGTAAPAHALAPAAAAKACHAGYRHAVIGGRQKCLRAGEFCAHRYDGQYRRYGYRCVRYDRRVHRYRLTYG
jgi:hypothetical protein